MVEKVENENSIVEIKKFLSTEERPISMDEFKQFWDTCTEEEKQEFKNAKLE